MKRIGKLLPLLLVCVLLLSGCGTLKEAVQEADELPVKEYINAVSSGDTDTVREMTHPSVAGKVQFERNINMLRDYLEGRTALTVRHGSVSLNTNTSVGEGTVRTLRVEYTVTLDDGTGLPVTVVYTNDRDGEGFSALLMQLGIS